MTLVESEKNIQVGLETTLSVEQMMGKMGFAEIEPGGRLLEAAKKEVARQYSTLSTDRMTTPDSVYQDLCEDGYDNNGRSITMVGVLEGRGTDFVLTGTVRLVVGGNNKNWNLPSLDVMNLFDVPEWPHRVRGVVDEKTGELGRFVVPSHFRSPKMDAAGVTNHITRGLFNKALSIGRERVGIESLYAIMPDYVVERVVGSGIGVREVMGAQPKQDDSTAQRTFAKYDVYWQKMQPKLYEFMLPE